MANPGRLPATPLARPVVSRVAGMPPGGRAGSSIPCYVTRDQARAMIDAAPTMRVRLLLECLWQSGGRLSELLRLRPCDVDADERALRLVNLKQQGRRRNAPKQCYVSRGLVAQLQVFAKDARVKWDGYYFTGLRSRTRPISRQEGWYLVRQAAARAGVQVVGHDGQLRLANALDFRHGAAVHLLRAGQPLTLVQAQLGHARIETTTIYTALSNQHRRELMDQVEW